MALQILAVREDKDGDITHLKGVSWEDTVEGVMNDIEARRYDYHVRVAGQDAAVYVVPATLHHKRYLKTRADTTTRNNLDELPPF